MCTDVYYYNPSKKRFTVFQKEQLLFVAKLSPLMRSDSKMLMGGYCFAEILEATCMKMHRSRFHVHDSCVMSIRQLLHICREQRKGVETKTKWKEKVLIELFSCNFVLTTSVSLNGFLWNQITLSVFVNQRCWQALVWPTRLLDRFRVKVCGGLLEAPKEM